MQSHVSSAPGFSRRRDRVPLQVHFLRRCFQSESRLPNSPSESTPESSISPESDLADPSAKSESYNQKPISRCQPIILLRISSLPCHRTLPHPQASLRLPSFGSNELTSRKKQTHPNREPNTSCETKTPRARRPKNLLRTTQNLSTQPSPSSRKSLKTSSFETLRRLR